MRARLMMLGIVLVCGCEVGEPSDEGLLGIEEALAHDDGEGIDLGDPDDLLNHESSFVPQTADVPGGPCHIIRAGGPMSYFGPGHDSHIFLFFQATGEISGCRQLCDPVWLGMIRQNNPEHEWRAVYWRTQLYGFCSVIAADTWVPLGSPGNEGNAGNVGDEGNEGSAGSPN